MYLINYHEILPVLIKKILEVQFNIDPWIFDQLKKAETEEINPMATDMLRQLIENSRVAAEERLPLCQDTGTFIFHVELGQDVQLVGGEWTDLFQKVAAQARQNGYLRPSIVIDPLRRQNSGDNTPASVHYQLVPGERLAIHFCAKGGGAENKSRLYMLNPTSSVDDVLATVIDHVKKNASAACPPLVIGIGLGGNFESCPYLAKKALFRPLESEHPDPFYAQLENDWLQAINQTGVGVQGIGGTHTAMRVLIEAGPCHIASLPLAINLNCHSHRHFSHIFHS